ncbi:MAG TPA: LysR family transcriptional regulator [Silvibacterium sp.]|nr:LysR family transcriptional regulator [Silvibacterium sp.]
MNISTIDLNLLVPLEALLAERSVTRAASRVGLSQPAMSNALARLRAIFRDPLLVRTGRAMALTTRGEALIQPVRNTVSQIRRVMGEENRFTPATCRSSFSLATTDYWEFLFLPRVMRRLQMQAPHVSLEVKRLVAGQFEPPVSDLRSSAFDVAIGFFPQVPITSSDFYSETLCSDMLCSVIGRSNKQIGSRLTLATYLNHGHVVIKYREIGGITSTDSVLARAGKSRNIRLIVPHYFDVPHVVCQTNLIGSLPTRMARKFSSRLPIRILRPPMRLASNNLVMLWHERTHSDPAQVWFRQLLVTVAHEG